MKCVCLTKKKLERCSFQARFPLESPAFCGIHHKSCSRIINDSCTVSGFVNNVLLGVLRKKKNKNVYYYTNRGNVEILKQKMPKSTQSIKHFLDDNFFDWHECLILRQFNHKNIIKLIKCGLKDDYLFLVTSRCEGDITRFPFDSNTASSCHCQILTALEKIQKQQIVHRDIHKGNIFWKSTNDATIDNVPTFGTNFILADFDMALSLHPLSNLRINPNHPHYVGRRMKRIPSGGRNLQFDSLQRCYLTDTRMIKSLELLNSIPIEFYTDIFALYKCIKDVTVFSSNYTKFLKNIRYIGFDKKFTTSRIDLFLAEEQKKKALLALGIT